MLKTIHFTTSKKTELTDITSEVQEIAKQKTVENGICIIYSPHTTAGITLNSASDMATADDIINEFDHIVPIRATFRHTLDTPADAAGHVKLVLVGNSVTLPIIKGELLLGHSQSVLFFEFDGPRDREAWVQILAEHG